jgi:alpha-1,3-rhamnosyl/mannosyltransferase
MTRRRVGINLLWLVPGVVGGSEEYTTRTLAGLHRLAPEDLDVTLFALGPFAAEHAELVEGFETVTLPLTGQDKSVRVAAESSWLALQGRRHQLELMHHAGGVMPLVRALPGVLTIHDVQPIVHPENFSPAKRAFSRVALPLSARAARLVLTPSEYSRQAIIDVLGVDPTRARVIPHGVPEPDPDPGEAADLRRLEAYGIKPPFLLYPAITYPHKNHGTLIRAFSALQERRPDLSLVLTGGEGTEERSLAVLVRELGVSSAVHRVGRIPRRDLDACLRQAAVLTFPSRYEGFGIPVLEAMAVGVPVVASDATAVPEVVGGAGLLVEPGDVDGWVDAVDAVLRDPGLRDRLVASGLERWRHFEQIRAARVLADAYRDAAQP